MNKLTPNLDSKGKTTFFLPLSLIDISSKTFSTIAYFVAHVAQAA